MHRKTKPQFLTKGINEDTREVSGIFMVHGNIDSGGDMSVPGSVARNMATETRSRVRHLWNHDHWSPPIATIKDIREVTRAQLPEAVLKYAPDATGGVEVTREYYKGIELADWVLAGLKAGDITEMSYAYDITESAFETIDGNEVHVLKGVTLYDTSDVNWGMNPATVAVKRMVGDNLGFAEHGQAVEDVLNDYLARIKDRRDFRVKAGRELSAANREMIYGFVESLTGIRDDLYKLWESTAPKAATDEIYSQFAQFLQTTYKNEGVI